MSTWRRPGSRRAAPRLGFAEGVARAFRNVAPGAPDTGVSVKMRAERKWRIALYERRTARRSPDAAIKHVAGFHYPAFRSETMEPSV